MSHAILPEYKKLLDIAISKKKENKNFIYRLKNARPKDLDEVTNGFHDEAFENIDCLKCANCCATTSPLIKNRDIETLSKRLNIRHTDFTEKYLRTDEDGDFIFKKVPCPFLGEDKHCSVYDSRPGACRDYPHTQQRNIAEKLPITFSNSMICPAVAVVVEKLKENYPKYNFFI